MSDPVTLTLAGPAEQVRAAVIALLGLDNGERARALIAEMDGGVDHAQEQINDLVGDLKEARFLFREKEKELEKVIEHRDSLIEGIEVIEVRYQEQIGELNVKVEALTAQNALLTSTLDMARADVERLQGAADKPKRERKPKPEAPTKPSGNVTAESAAVGPDGKWENDLDPAKDEVRPAPERKPDVEEPAPPTPPTIFSPGDVRAFVLAFIEGRPETTWGQVLESRDARMGYGQIEGALQQLRDEGLIEADGNEWDSPVRLVRTGQNKAPSLPDGEEEAPPAEGQARLAAFNPSAPTWVWEAAKNIEAFDKLPAANLTVDAPVFALLMDGTVKPGTIHRTYLGASHVLVQVEGKGLITLAQEKLRARVVEEGAAPPVEEEEIPF